MKAGVIGCLLSIITACQAKSAEANDGYFKMNFNVQRGNGLSSASIGAAPKFVKRDDSVDVKLTNADTFYLSPLEIGSNGDKVEVLVDTGSSDLWVMSSDLKCFSVSSNSAKKALANRKGGVRLPSKTDNIAPENKDALASILSEIGEFSDVAIETFTEFPGDASDIPLPGYASDIPFGGDDSYSTPTGDATNTCTSYGSFSTENSDSFKRNESAPPFEIAYGDGTEAFGIWGNDDVKIGDVTVKKLSFAIANESSSDIGVLGIGLAGLEVTSSYLSSSDSLYEYQNLPLKMVSQGLIKRAAYSIFLDSESADYGSVLFGAVDHSKYVGNLIEFPIVNPLESYGIDTPIETRINLDSIKISNGNKNGVLTDVGYTALLDSGTTLTYFPTEVLLNLGEALELDYDRRAGAYAISCDVNSDPQLSFNFSGNKFNVSISQFIISAEEESGESGSRSSGSCYLGILPQDADQNTGENYIILGDNFIRNFYAVYDLENYNIALAYANFDNSTSEKIDVISSSIPSATKASSYSSTEALTGGSEPSGISFSFDVNKVTGDATITTDNAGNTDASNSDNSDSSSSSSSSSDNDDEDDSSSGKNNSGSILFPSLILLTLSLLFVLNL